VASRARAANDRPRSLTTEERRSERVREYNRRERELGLDPTDDAAQWLADQEGGS
jgi:hypothetical protein